MMALREAAEQYFGSDGMLALFDAVPGLVVVKDVDENILGACSDLAAAVGTTPDEMVGSPIDRWCPPEIAEQFRATDQQVLETGEPVIGVRKCESDGPSADRVYVTDKYPIRGRDGRIDGFIAIAREVESEDSAEAASADVAPTVESSRDAERATEVFHDVRNLLGAAAASLELVELEIGSDSPAVAHLHRAQRALWRANDLGADVLLEARERRSQRAAIDLSELVAETCEIMGGLFPARVQLAYACSPTPPRRSTTRRSTTRPNQNCSTALVATSSVVQIARREDSSPKPRTARMPGV